MHQTHQASNSLAVFAHKSEICSSSQTFLNLQITQFRNELLMLILALRAPIVDEPCPLPKWRQPECTTHDTWHQPGEGLVIKGLRPTRRSSSGGRAAIISSKPPELGIELSLNRSELVVGTVVWLRT